MIVLALLLSDCPATALPSGAHHLTIAAREYDVIVPKAALPKAGFPVVLALPGANTNPVEFNATTRLPEVAGRDPFVLVLPNGVSDVASVKALLDALPAQVCVDPERLFAVGHSDGAALVHKLACELSDKLAAVAAVSGNIRPDLACKPKRRIPILQVHGSADTCFDEKDAIKDWREKNGCGERTRVIHKVGSTTCKVQDGCPDHADVVSCVVKGGGQGWPGAILVGQNKCGGQQLMDFNASNYIWTFFKSHPLPAPATVNVGRPLPDGMLPSK